ncbi:hypothetical protein Tcan_01471, partial [Toxocara canis]
SAGCALIIGNRQVAEWEEIVTHVAPYLLVYIQFQSADRRYEPVQLALARCSVRPPRTCCPFRGTPEWASGNAQKGREQTRYDDLIAWLYVTCELFATEKDPAQPLPWTYRSNNRVSFTPILTHDLFEYSEEHIFLVVLPF